MAGRGQARDMGAMAMNNGQWQQQELERLEADFLRLRAMWNSPLMVAQQQVRLLARAGYRLIPGPEVLARGPRWAWNVPLAVAGAMVGTVLIFIVGILIGWEIPGSP